MAENNMMESEETVWWLEVLEANLLSDDYEVKTDMETHFKIAAIRSIVERNKELEDMLDELTEYRDRLAAIIGPRL